MKFVPPTIGIISFLACVILLTVRSYYYSDDGELLGLGVRSDQGLLEIQIPLALRTTHRELSDTSFFVWEWADGYWGKWDNPVVVPLRERLQHIWGFGYYYDDNSGNYLRQGPLLALSVPIWFPLLSIHLCALAWYYQRIGLRTFFLALTAVAFVLGLLLIPAAD